MSGPAIVHILRRAFYIYGDKRYEQLAQLSVSHLYNVRKSAGYQNRLVHFTRTCAVCNPIAVRKPTRPNDRAGSLFKWGVIVVIGPMPQGNAELFSLLI